MKCVHVSSFGMCEAKPASELIAGDVIIHSFGYKSNVLEITRQTENSVFVRLQAQDSGHTCERRYLKTRLVPIKV